jgi:hypothetical protein
MEDDIGDGYGALKEQRPISIRYWFSEEWIRAASTTIH